jgi:hypothetical protein
MPNKANQPLSTMCHSVAGGEVQHQQNRAEERMTALAQRLGELIGRAITEKHCTAGRNATNCESNSRSVNELTIAAESFSVPPPYRHEQVRFPKNRI